MILLTASSAGLTSSCPVWVDLKLFRAFVRFFCCFFSPAHVIAESVHASRLRQKANNHRKQSSHFYSSPLISCYWSRIEAQLSTWTSVLHIDIISADKLNLRIGYFILRISSYSTPYTAVYPPYTRPTMISRPVLCLLLPESLMLLPKQAIVHIWQAHSDSDGSVSSDGSS